MADTKKNKEVKKSNTVLMWVCVAAITIITLIVFLPSLDNGFTNWDDNDYVTNNPLVITNSVPVVKIFETPVSAHYHPLTILSLALNYQFGNLNPYGYHLVNLVLHLLNTILLFFFIFLLTRRNLLMAAIVSLFFGIHPMHVESVAWVSERKDVLYVFFFLLGLITYLRYSETRKTRWYVFTFVLFILSCLSKEMAVVFPVVLLLIDYLKNDKWERRLFIEKIPFFLIAIILTLIEIKIQSGSVNIKAFNIFQRLLFASYSTILYIVKLFIPFKLSVFYPFPDISNPIPVIFYLSPFIVLLLLGITLYAFLKKQKEITFGLLFYFATIVLVIQLVPIDPGIIPDRYSYLSYIGLLFVIAYFIDKMCQNRSRIWSLMKYPILVVVGLAAVVFSYQSYIHTQVWTDAETLWTDAINNNPDAYEPYYIRGSYYYTLNDVQKALPDFNKAIELNPNFALPYNARGAIYAQMGKIDQAFADYNKAIECNPNTESSYYNRALIYSTYYKKNDLAIADYTKTIELAPRYADAYLSRGLLYYQSGEIDLAMADFNKAIELAPANANAYNDRGMVYYFNYGKDDLAIADYTKAITLDSAMAPFYYNRGLCYNALDQYEKAMDDFTKAIRINPSVAVFWFNRSLVENKLGRNDDAKADGLKAQQLQVPRP